MTKLPWWKRLMMAAGGGAAVLLAVVGQAKRGDSAEPTAPAQSKAFKYYGSATCSACHATTPDGPKTPFGYSVEFIKLNESITWEKEDKHSVAYKRLDSERGRRMASLLKIDVNQREAGCLNCHSASTAEMANRFKQGIQYNPSEGVSCENCHGPYSGWAGEHMQETFRTTSTADWEKVGFVDLRSPDRKAEKCLSCHIGSVGEGKVVTHEMYAAGHPPLPSIEVATFADSIPRHWWLNSERKNDEIKKSLGYVEGQLEETRLAFVGAAVALRTSMRLLADEAAAKEKEGAPGQEWPDYARFDCWSCHHDLKRESWRQARGYHEGPPGRVPVSEWPLTLVELGIDHLAGSDPAEKSLAADLAKYRNALREQANARPFGRKANMARAAGDFAAWSDLLVKKLSTAQFDKAAASKLLRKLVEKADLSPSDYDPARHVGWTIQLLVHELGDTLPNRPAIEGVLAKIREGLKLDLPAGRKYEIEDQIAHALEVIGDYEPAAFQAQLKELLALLPPG